MESLKVVGHASYWSERALKAICGTDNQMKNPEVQSLRKIVCGWHFTEAGYPDKGAGYPRPAVIRAIRELENYCD